MLALDHMLTPRSVAVVGASERRGSVGDQTVRQLISGGFEGPIYPVNPGYDTIAGLTSYPTIGDIGAPIDVAVLAVSNANLETETERAVKAGARSLVIFASCHGKAADGVPLRRRIAEIVSEAMIPVCGGNGMGLLNIEYGLRLCGFFQPPGLRSGGISFLTHSGSLFSAMLHNHRDLGFNLVVSTGLEFNTRMSDYLGWVLDQASTDVVALFMETVRDPVGFENGLRHASDRQIPVVALKVGASSRGRTAVATHSEAIAGEDVVYDALFDAYGVHRVQSMDEMLDTVELMASRPKLFPGGLGAVHDSGGERALLIDTADRVGVPLPRVSTATAASLALVLDPGLEPENPVDAWGTGREADEVFVACLDALAGDPAVAVLAFAVDLTEEEEAGSEYGLSVARAAKNTDKPTVVLTHVSSAIDDKQARYVRESGVPILEGTETGLRAIRHLLDRAERASWPERAPRLTTPVQLDVRDPLRLLDSYGIPVVETLVAGNEEEAVAVAETISFPVVLKTAGLSHKTEVDGVRLGLADERAVVTAYQDISGRLGPMVTVSRQLDPGVEIGLGSITDPQFGPVVVISAGGVLIEILSDVVAFFPPVDSVQARRALDRLAVGTLLSGVRGSAPADVEALSQVVARFSELVADQAGVIDSIDLNPVIAGPDAAVAVDVLVKWLP
ncbi:MAG TPA: acetate--CoA ligase family protein [Acidimicrobiia bacterium]|nr:acetate--CoA ligase family protein [Acidimicrobiia bacterium]